MSYKFSSISPAKARTTPITAWRSGFSRKKSTAINVELISDSPWVSGYSLSLIHILFDALPMLLSARFDYELWYSYAAHVETPHGGVLFPYCLLLPQAVFLLHRDGQQALILRDPELDVYKRQPSISRSTFLVWKASCI